MTHRFVLAALVALCIGALGASQASAASPVDSGASASKKKGAKKTGKKKVPKSKTWEVCKHGCKYKTIQKAVNAAGSYKAKAKFRKVKAYVKVKPGKYV